MGKLMKPFTGRTGIDPLDLFVSVGRISISNNFNIRFDVCPVCGIGMNYRYLRCPLLESGCENGHRWHVCILHHQLIIGPVDRRLGTFECHCYPDVIIRDLLA